MTIFAGLGTMTKLEQSYRDNIGKLYVYKTKEWDYNKRKWADINALVMIKEVTKNGGWFHYVSEIIKRDIQIKNEGKEYTIPCKEFHRKALLAALSQLGDTFNKEVA
jgi:hypothetical protein